MLNSLERAAAGAAKWLHWLGIYVCLPLLGLLISLDVVLRYAFAGPLIWGKEVSGLLLLALLIVGIPWATAQDRHIRMSLVYDRLGARGQRAANAVASLAGLVFAATLGYDAFASIPGMIVYRDVTEIAALPHWPLSALIGLCAVVLALQFGTALVRAPLGTPPQGKN